MFGWIYIALCSLLVMFAILMVSARRPISSAVFLVLTLIGIGVLYLMMNAPLVATLQWLVYAGAIMVLFVFVVMLFQLRELNPTSISTHPGRFALLLLLGGGFLGLCLKGVIVGLQEQPVIMMGQTLVTGEASLKDFSLLLFSKHVFAFELLSVVLLATLVGAILLARRKQRVS